MDIDDFIPLEDVIAELEERDRRRAAKPKLVRKVIEAWWWVRRKIKYPPRPWSRVKQAYQRLSRGYSDRDWWGFDSFLAGIIADGCKKFREEGHGWPGTYRDGSDMTIEQWNDILTKIEDGFRAHLENDDFPDEERRKELTAKFEEGGKLFIEYFGSLWD
jgi:hypothetical protein